MEQLKINFFKIRNVLLMHIVSQPDSIKLGDFRFVSSDGIFFESSSEPQILSEGIYLRGTAISKHDKTAFIDLGTVNTAERQLQLFQRGLKELQEFLDSGMKEEKRPTLRYTRPPRRSTYTIKEDTSSEPTYWTA